VAATRERAAFWNEGLESKVRMLGSGNMQFVLFGGIFAFSPVKENG